MSTDFQRAVQEILEVIIFENWLRFYFISSREQDEKLCLAVPEKGVERIRELHAHLVPLLEDVNGKEISFELSRRAVCSFVVTQLDGQSIPRNMADLVFESSVFQLEMQLFNNWVQVHEEQLDKDFLDFAAWKKIFAEWRKSDKVREWAASLESALHAETNATTQ